jgi:enoyl-CoA hydratase/carnithine racemase
VFPSPAAAIFPRLVGLKKAFELILTGNIILVAEAERIGIVNRVEIDKRTDNLCSKSSVVLQLTRKAILESKNLDLVQVMTRSNDYL